MSFRRRLTIFFLIIVVLPMLAVTVLLVQVGSEAENARADARLAASLNTALVLFREDGERAAEAARTLASPGGGVAGPVARGDGEEVAPALRTALRRFELYSIELLDAEGAELARVGGAEPASEVEVGLVGERGELGTLSVSARGAREFAERAEELTGASIVIADPTAAQAPPRLPSPGDTGTVDVDGSEMRAAVARFPDGTGRSLAVMEPAGEGGVLGSRPAIAVGLAIFFALALGFVAIIMRSLQGQIAAMLNAARRVGAGDFSSRVPVEGRDELAGLASEFNKMSARLGEQVEELQRQRVEIEHSVKRLGEAVASGLDREALLRIIVETTLGACGAEFGNVRVRGNERVAATVPGVKPSRELREAVRAAERRAASAQQPVEARRGDAHALAAPLSHLAGESESLGTLAVGRTARPFEEAERELFVYMLTQAAASIENVALHERVSTEAVTDELTGIANLRSFRETLAKEIARARRFGHPLSMLMLDIDDFKPVNDNLGHLQGDEVLRAIGEILASESREIDEPARYGGEEFVVALPETDTEGASEVAERIRGRIEEEAVPLLEGDGELSVTASIGVATLNGGDQLGSDGVTDLVAAADAALYEAKRAGKNRVQIAS